MQLDNRIKPNLFIVGMPKSGTTALHNLLSQHPEVFMSSLKEPNYFCFDMKRDAQLFIKTNPHPLRNTAYKIRFPCPTEEQYLRLFENSAGFKIRGESSVRYIRSKEAPKNMWKFSPGCKVLVIFREPIAFLRSLHNQTVKSGCENIINFEKAIRLSNNRNPKTFLPRIILPERLNYLGWINYTRDLLRLLTYIPKKNIKVILYEEFKENNKGIYLDILEFLGISTKHLPHQFSYYNTSMPIRLPGLKNFVGNTKLWRLPKRLFPATGYELLRTLFRFIVIKQKNGSTIAPEFQKHLKRELKPEVQRFSSLLYREGFYSTNLIEKWGYGDV